MFVLPYSAAELRTAVAAGENRKAELGRAVDAAQAKLAAEVCQLSACIV